MVELTHDARRLLTLIFIGSVTVLVQTLVQDKDWDFYWLLALVVSAISTAITTVMLALMTMKSGYADDNLHMVAGVLVIMWIAGTGIMTLVEPYELTGNGYFGAWLALIASWLLGVQHYPRLREPMDRLITAGGSTIAVLFLASLTVFVQTIFNCVDHSGYCEAGEVIWILICSLVSIVVCFLLMFMSDRVQESFKFVALFFFVWWSIGTFIATFDQPYLITGNGYFGCWVAWGASAVLLDFTWNLNASSQARKAPWELTAIFLASVVVLCAATYERSVDDFEDWVAVLVSASSLIICLVVLIFAFAKSEVQEDMLRGVSAVLLVIWLLAAFICTFVGPFTFTGNGYFGCWVAVVAASVFIGHFWTSMHDLQGRVGQNGIEMAIMVMASVVLLIQALTDCAGDDVSCDGRWMWALICSGATLTFVGFCLTCYEKIEQCVVWLVLALVILWIIGVGILTFEYPYYYTGNAYFAAWIGLVSTALLFIRIMPWFREGSSSGGGPAANTIGVRS